MKIRNFFAMFICILATLLISGCCNHQWTEANCGNPKTCTLCGETEGDPVGEHQWEDATCTEPKTCSVCGQTDGEALGHEFGTWETKEQATLRKEGEKIRTCDICGYEETGTIPQISEDEAAEILSQAEESMESGYLSQAKELLSPIAENETASKYIKAIDENLAAGWEGIYQSAEDDEEFYMILCCLDTETLEPNYVVCNQNDVSEYIYYNISPTPDDESFTFADTIDSTVSCKYEDNFVSEAKYRFQPDQTVYTPKSGMSGYGSAYSIVKKYTFTKTDGGLNLYRHLIGTPSFVSDHFQPFDNEYNTTYKKLDMEMTTVQLKDSTYNMDNSAKELTTEQKYDLAIEGYNKLKNEMKDPNSLKILGVKYNSEQRKVIFKYSGINSFGKSVTCC